MTAYLDRPIFVTGSPRTGTTLMQHCLARDESLYRLERESRFLWHRLGAYERTGDFPSRDDIEAAYLGELFRNPVPMRAANLRRWVLRASSVGTPSGYWDISHDLQRELSPYDAAHEPGPFARTEQDETAPFTIPPESCDWAVDADGPVRMADKDTGHCWRLPALADCFPDATFVFMLRSPEHAITSLINAWLHPYWFFTYNVDRELRIPGYSDRFAWGDRWWNVNLFPGWESLVDAPLHEVCARQWEAAVLPMLRDGQPLVDAGRAMYVSYDRLVADPVRVLGDVSDLTGIDPVIAAPLGKEFMTVDPATKIVRPDSPEVVAAVELIGDTVDRIRNLVQ